MILAKSAPEILIVDFGSQTCHLIGRRLRDLGVNVEIVLPRQALVTIKIQKPKGVILSGGPDSVYERGSLTIDKKIFSLGIPILGICYGWQLTAKLLDGKVVLGKKEFGPANLLINRESPLFSGVDSYTRVWVSHGDTVVKMPSHFVQLGQTQDVEFAAVCNIQNNIYGVQFHPEVEHTPFGSVILKNFAQRVCRLRFSKRLISLKKLIHSIQREVKNGDIICAVSGGIDSTVTSLLIGKALRNRLHPIYVESGLMRERTKEEVTKLFKKYLGIRPIIVEARNLFLQKLRGIANPEEKRKVIGNLYIRLFEQQAKKIKNVKYLAQGTIYSDVIESKGTTHADKIKSHHNVGGLPARLKLKLLEPLRFFYKDEVRAIAEKLGLPKEIVYKQVFPGPGNAIRIIGEVTKERLEKQKLCDAIVVDEIKKARRYNKTHMSFSVLTGVKSTAVKGDERELLEVVAVRVIESKDIMTTDWTKLPYDVMQRISSRIVNEVPGVSRVVYDITTKPPATMEWE
ncbi:glutamine-hydrolyzing GMP synthase [Candidatus Roizmanbacteria bacterium]|nr:glutamine-hydrolyzing GMP synthase [Candidatus Roizmanbacteria bacterium]